MSKKNLPLFKVNMPKDVHLALQPVLESGFVSEGPKSKEFQEKLQEWLGNPFTATVNSGTTALTLAYRLAGVGPGTSVIASPMTCLASTEPILSLGGEVIWCDIDPATGNIDPSKLEALVREDTVAVSFTDWAGTPCALDEIIDICQRHGLKTIEDAAHSFGATYKGNKVGSLATGIDYTCFSFQAIKHMTTVDGGALACASEEDFERATLLRWFGCARGHNSSPVKWSGDVVEYGYKGHMNDVNATIGLESLKTIDSFIASHKSNGNYLLALLKDVDGVDALEVPPDIDSAFWIFTIKLKDAAHRRGVSEKLTAAGIGNNIVHTRNDSYSLYNHCAPTSMPGMDTFSERMLNIPCGWWLSEEDLEYIADTLRGAA
jgi:dTDP-4-amino-4,6-dideoxygalactose transaminase